MKREMTSVDVAAMVSELQHLAGARIEKIYKSDTETEQIRLNLYLFGEGRCDLVIDPGVSMHLTAHPQPGPKLPPTFAMTLRKYLSHGRIVSIEQYEFDRIIEIKTMRGEVANTLIIELFSSGNAILANDEQKIILPMRPVTFRGRRIRSGEIYKLPDMQLNPVKITSGELSDLFSKSDINLVKTLATNLNMGGTIAEEVCSVSGIDKNLDCQDISGEMSQSMHQGIMDVFGRIQDPKPHIIYHDKKKIDVLPFEISKYADHEKRYFNTFNEALDEFFDVMVGHEKKQSEIARTKKNPLEHRLAQQENAILKFEREKSGLETKAETIYMHYQLIDESLAAIGSALANGRGWGEITEIVKQADHPTARMIKRIDPHTKTITMELDQADIALNIGKSVPQNAQAYYDKSKKLSLKRAGATRALEHTRELIEKEVKKAKSARESKIKPSTLKRPKPRWYHRFRWFVSSDGLLVVGGRDATSNEEIVKKYLEKRDVFVHTQAPGAPVTIIKVEGGGQVPEQTIAEAAQFAVSYSNIWKESQYTGDCYWVHPDQVSKTPEHGEFVAKGAFIIRGKRNYTKNVSIGVAIGITDGMELIGGPVSAVKKHAGYVIEIMPGRFNQNDLAKKIYRTYSDVFGRQIKVVAPPDQIARFLPPGGSEIKNMSGKAVDSSDVR
ncbi:MAG: fibronectin-binding domain-containing protein [Methanosarcinales archaeon]|nr:MAG: fibronectin-binding domain-containing protein [Methanosarcinales archaeon]